ncbi:MAG: DUF2975 domain-containing protein [Thermoanaerobaculia bacterium]
MTRSHPRELTLSNNVLKTFLVLNPIFGVFVMAMFIATFFAPSWMMRALTHEHGASQGPEFHALLIGMRWIMLLGSLGAVLVQVALTRLLAIVQTVSVGDPFVLLNAERLKTIAWAMLGGEILHFVIGMIARGISTETHQLDIDWKFNFTRWIFVLFLFVLARVFEQGARMREDLEGTV